MGNHIDKPPIESLPKASAEEVITVNAIRQNKEANCVRLAPSTLPEAFQGFRSNGPGLGNPSS